ncbi:peptide chain release factor N(5)-glutamine methyltransferase [Desulfobacula sp.]|uniref:peptide chain release factor N(5)-glutamine methyltransferase n=1 Tax=Desulfobacula sp. TaxID=2593537 RepID=UPI0026226148|nr:peptide chain release factor N(5)-glutamine methyltransferase [Desulfobacula sp.]
MIDWTIIKILSWTESYFKDHWVDSPRLTAEILLAYCLGIGRLDLYLQHDRPLQKNELSDFKRIIKRRIGNEPVAYITGEKGFFDSDFEVASGVLIPRPDTETIVEAALMVLNRPPESNDPKTVLELGTGSGAIVVSLAKARPDHRYFASDISPAALSMARKNAERIAGDTIGFFQGAWFSSLKRQVTFDLIVSNPPYIPVNDIQHLQPEIREFEPLLALDGGRDGLDSFRSILSSAHYYLVPGGTLLLEMGFDQREGLNGLFEQYPHYASIDFIKDLAGHDRVALIKK